MQGALKLCAMASGYKETSIEESYRKYCADGGFGMMEDEPIQQDEIDPAEEPLEFDQEDECLNLLHWCSRKLSSLILTWILQRFLLLLRELTWSSKGRPMKIWRIWLVRVTAKKGLMKLESLLFASILSCWFFWSIVARVSQVLFVGHVTRNASCSTCCPLRRSRKGAAPNNPFGDNGNGWQCLELPFSFLSSDEVCQRWDWPSLDHQSQAHSQGQPQLELASATRFCQQ